MGTKIADNNEVWPKYDNIRELTLTYWRVTFHAYSYTMQTRNFHRVVKLGRISFLKKQQRYARNDRGKRKIIIKTLAKITLELKY